MLIYSIKIISRLTVGLFYIVNKSRESEEESCKILEMKSLGPHGMTTLQSRVSSISASLLPSVSFPSLPSSLSLSSLSLSVSVCVCGGVSCKYSRAREKERHMIYIFFLPAVFQCHRFNLPAQLSIYGVSEGLF